MEVSALKYSGGIGLHARSPLLRLQSDERLVALVRRGNSAAFEVLVSRYECRLGAFCRHLLGSREDAEDVLQEALAAAFNAMLADNRPINVKPWLYRIARNRGLNHLRRARAIGMDSMDIHLADHGQSTAEKVHEREEFKVLVGDIHELPETQKTALVLREMDALSYEQIAEAMETTVPSVKSLLVRARVSLAEAAEARLLSCDEVRIELGELAEGLRRRPSPLVRRHLGACSRCSSFREQLKHTNKALAAVLPIGPMVILKKLLLTHAGHSAGSGATASGAAGSTAAAGGAALVGSGGGGFLSAGIGAIATKAAAGLAAAALVTGAAVEVVHTSRPHLHHGAAADTTTAVVPSAPGPAAAGSGGAGILGPHDASLHPKPSHTPPRTKHSVSTTSSTTAIKSTNVSHSTSKVSHSTSTTSKAGTVLASAPARGRTQTQTDPTVLTPAPTPTTPPTPPQQTRPVAPALAPSAPTQSSASTSSTTTTQTQGEPTPPPSSDPPAGP